MKIKLKLVKEQVVVVFGASSGIGRETAVRFARKGAKVIAAARSPEGLRSLVDEIKAFGGSAIALPADASNFLQVKAVADLAVQQYGRLDTWVHAAAVAVYAPFEETTPEEFARIIDVNLNGQAYGAQAALPYLKERGGALIHISSVEALRPLPLHSAYSASKHGVHAMVETLRMELKHDKALVSVTEIMPASINTPFFNHARTKIGVKPMGIPPIYEPRVVAKAILYAASHPVREMIVGGAGKFLAFSQRTAPRVADAVIDRIGYKGQETKEAKSADAPYNLYSPIPGYDRAKGDFSAQAKSRSIDTWFGTHPLARKALLGAALSGAALLALRMRGGSGESSFPGMEAGTEAETVLEVTTTEVITPVEVLVVEADTDGTEGMDAGIDPEAIGIDADAEGTDSMSDLEETASVVPIDGSEFTGVTAESDDPNATQKVYIDRPAPEPLP